MAHCGTKLGTNAGGRLKLQRPEKYGQEAYAQYTSNGAMDLRSQLDVGGSEDGTDMDTHGGPARTQNDDKAFPNITEGRQEMQVD